MKVVTISNGRAGHEFYVTSVAENDSSIVNSGTLPVEKICPGRGIPRTAPPLTLQPLFGNLTPNFSSPSQSLPYKQAGNIHPCVTIICVSISSLLNS